MTILNKFKIPTLVGLGVILAGITAGVILVIRDQEFFAKASPDLAPQNITISNIGESEVTISWQTSAPAVSFVTFGLKGAKEQIVLDDRDTKTPSVHSLHYATIKNLKPQISYRFTVISNKLSSDTLEFKTASSQSFQNGFGPIIGTVFDGDEPISEGIAYLSIPNAATQSAIVKNMGGFLIPISLMYKGDLSDTYQTNEEDVAKLTVIAPNGRATALFKIKAEGVELSPINLGENIDLTIQSEVSEAEKYDLNGDLLINSIDYSMVLQNFGKSPKNQRADFNSDGVVDQNDLDLLNDKIINQ